jgi:hypothetical protein
MQDIVDDQRDEFLRKLVRAVIVGTIRDNYRKAKGVMVCPDQMVAASLGG